MLLYSSSRREALPAVRFSLWRQGRFSASRGGATALEVYLQATVGACEAPETEQVLSPTQSVPVFHRRPEPSAIIVAVDVMAY